MPCNIGRAVGLMSDLANGCRELFDGRCTELHIAGRLLGDSCNLNREGAGTPHVGIESR